MLFDWYLYRQLIERAYFEGVKYKMDTQIKKDEIKQKTANTEAEIKTDEKKADASTKDTK